MHLSDESPAALFMCERQTAEKVHRIVSKISPEFMYDNFRLNHAVKVLLNQNNDQKLKCIQHLLQYM